MKSASTERPSRGGGYRPRLKTTLRKLAVGLVCLVAAVVGFLLSPFAKKRKDFDPHSVERILVIRLDLLGDLVLSMPAVQALKDANPSASISMLALPYTAPLLGHYPIVEKVFTYDVNRLRPSGEMLNLAAYRDLWRMLRDLRSERFDLAISLHGIWGSLLAFVAGAKFRAGYVGESCPHVLNLGIPGKRYSVRRHEADYCLDLVRSLGAPERSYELRLAPLPEAEHSVDELLRRLGVDAAKEMIALHVGASNGAAKRWIPQSMAALADKLIEEEKAEVVFTGSQYDLASIQEVTGLMRHSPVVVAGSTSIPELVAVLTRCRLLVSGDSGPMHIANALGVPVVAIHGPTDPALSGPYGKGAIVVRKDVPCGPCYDLSAAADCPRNDPICMKGITVDEVFSAAQRQLGRQPVPNPN